MTFAKATRLTLGALDMYGMAVKHFETSVAAKLVEKEASYLQLCCHINLPFIFGMNNNSKPLSIVTQFYGDKSFKPVTLIYRFRLA